MGSITGIETLVYVDPCYPQLLKITSLLQVKSLHVCNSLGRISPSTLSIVCYLCALAC